jgi:hypothetical protein
MKAQIEEMPVLREPDVCCPEFHPEVWDNTKHEWTNKLFLKDTVPEIFHIPMPASYRKVITRMQKKIEAAGATPESDDYLLLTYDPTPFKGVLLLSISKEIPGEEMVRLTGTFMSKVFEGPYSHVPKFMKEMDSWLGSQNLQAKKHYIFYAYCPQCASKYGHNYIVDLAEV